MKKYLVVWFYLTLVPGPSLVFNNYEETEELTEDVITEWKKKYEKKFKGQHLGFNERVRIINIIRIEY